MIEVDLNRLTDSLIEAKLLAEWDAEDRQRIAEALEQAVDVWSVTSNGS